MAYTMKVQLKRASKKEGGTGKFAIELVEIILLEKSAC